MELKLCPIHRHAYNYRYPCPVCCDIKSRLVPTPPKKPINQSTFTFNKNIS